MNLIRIRPSIHASITARHTRGLRGGRGRAVVRGRDEGHLGDRGGVHLAAHLHLHVGARLVQPLVVPAQLECERNVSSRFITCCFQALNGA
jgi:hypothetical protein